MFKVGDKVRRINEHHYALKVGDIATVVKLEDAANIYVTNDAIKNDKKNWSSGLDGSYGVMPVNLELWNPLTDLL
jgi:hypothetical protein